MLGGERTAVWSTLGGECRAFLLRLATAPRENSTRCHNFRSSCVGGMCLRHS